MERNSNHDFHKHPAACLECCLAISGILERRGRRRWRIQERLIELTVQLCQVFAGFAMATLCCIEYMFLRPNATAPQSRSDHQLPDGRWLMLSEKFHPLDREANFKNGRRIELLKTDIARGIGDRDTKIRDLERELAINAQHIRSIYGHLDERDIETHTSDD